MNFETILTHGGWKSEEGTRACATPIYQTSSFTLDDTQYAKDLFDGTRDGNIYTRIMNPTTDVLEKRVAMLEGGVGALATSSGMSALLITALTILKSGDEVVDNLNKSKQIDEQLNDDSLKNANWILKSIFDELLYIFYLLNTQARYCADSK